MIAGSALCLLAFVLVERRIAERGGSPLIRERVLRSPGLAAAVAAMFLIMAGVGGFMFSVTLHLQAGLGFSALRNGLTFAPMTGAFGLAGLYWRRLPAAWHPRITAPALLACALGYLVLGRALAGGGSVTFWLAALMLVMGAAIGVGYGQLFGSALSRVQVPDAADASGVVVTLIQLGQVVGVAAVGSLFLGALATPVTASSSGHAVELAVTAVGACTAAAAVVALLRPREGQA